MTIPIRVRIQAAGVRAAYALPKALRRAIAGPPIRRDGRQLAPEAQLLLRLQRLSGTHLVRPGGVVDSREAMDLGRHLVGGPPIGRVLVRDLEIPLEGRSLPATLYTPAGLAQPSGLLVYFHGGGWVLGTRASHDNTARFLALRAGVRVLSVEYRLAPEHVFPAAVDDAVGAFDFACANAADLGADPARVAVGGDSAGGNLAAVTAQVTTARGGPGPVFQLLLYPATDASRHWPSRDLFGEGFFLTGADMDWFADHYAPAGVDRGDPRLSPLLADDLGGLPPAYLATAGFDPLRDEGDAYASRLAEAGVTVTHSRHPDLIHGYATLLGVGHRFREATAEAADALRRALTTS